jgi:uncharacterized protein YndB with AHSA1/START domain
METFKIEKKIVLKMPVERVFSALTNSHEIPKYFPLKSVESIWVVGSEVLYKGEVDGVPFTDFGIIEKLTYPAEYRYRYWSDNHGTKRTEQNYLTISYNLEKSNEGTVLTVTQSNIKSPEMYELMNGQVWDYLLNSFKEYIEANT